MKLSILICTLERRIHLLERLKKTMLRNFNGNPPPDVEIITNCDNGQMSIGAKRNFLLSLAKGEYVVFADDDDLVSNDYISQIISATITNPDAIGFKGWITTNGIMRKEWRISKNYGYEQKGGVYYRYNNHLSPVKREIALQIGFPDISHGEDFDYAKRLHESGLIKTEVFIDKHLYHYDYKTSKI